MKKTIMIIFIGSCILMAPAAGHTYYEEYRVAIREGVDTMIKSPKPLIESVQEEYTKAEFKPFGIFGGFFKGAYHSIKQFGNGLYQVLTFNVGEDNAFKNVLRK